MIEPPRSNVEPVVSLGDNQGPPKGELECTKEHSIFPAGDGNAILQIRDSKFETRKYILRKFAKLDATIPSGPDSCTITLDVDEREAEDFHNTFKVLYASVIEGPFEFDTKTLTSALHIATAYRYPALRTFAVKGLEKVSLGAAERIRLARTFDLAYWEEPAYEELCKRDEPITLEEAGALGLDTFVALAEEREKEQRRRGRLVDAAKETTAAGPSQSLPWGTTPRPSPEGNHSTSADGANGKVDAALNDSHKSVNTTPCFINTVLPKKFDQPSAIDLSIKLQVSDCSCRGGNKDGSFTWPAQCTLVPCAVAAFKELQVRQLAHAREIVNIKESVGQIKVAAATTRPEPSQSSRAPTNLEVPANNHYPAQAPANSQEQ